MDGDHILNSADLFPDNIFEDKETDADGVGDNEEVGPTGDLDDDGFVNKFDWDVDGDGVANTEDGIPLDPTETGDADGDNIGDIVDSFPDDKRYFIDNNGDGLPDSEQKDPNNNGIPDSMENPDK